MKETQFSQINDKQVNSKITAIYGRTCEPSTKNMTKQLNNLTNVANRYQFDNIRYFIDDGYPCADGGRPGFLKLMKAIRANEVSTLIIRDYSRLSRDARTQFNFMNELDLHGVRLLSVVEKEDRLPLHIHDDNNAMDYEMHGDYYYPMIIVSDPEKASITSQWADMRLRYLKEHKRKRFSQLVTTGKLNSHLTEIDRQARERFDTLMDAYKEKWHITEKLKAEDVMCWIQLMNHARAEAEWNVLNEIVHA